MNEILFKSLQIENFMSIGEGNLDLEDRGLLLIQGVNEDDSSANSNGSGKSSTVDALCWALYGVTARGKSGDGVVNRFEGKNCRVQVDFTIDGKLYTVQRHRKHSKGKNRLVFECDGADLTQGTDKLTQELVEKTIGCDLEVFTASVYAGQNRMPNLPGMTDKELKQLVERAAGIELLDASYAIARERLRTATNVHDTNNHSLNQKKAEIARLEELVEVHTNNREQWEENRAASIKASEERVKNLLVQARDAKAELDAFDELALRDEEAALQAELSKPVAPPPHVPDPDPPRLHERLDPPREPASLRLLQDELRQLQYKDGTLRTQITARMDEVKNLNATVGTDCTECGKEYCEDDLADRRKILMDRLGDLKAEFTGLQKQVKAAEAKVEAEKLACAAEVERVAEENRRIDQLNADLREQYQEARREASQKRSELHAQHAASHDKSATVARLSAIQKQLSEIQKLRSSVQALATEAKQVREQLETRKTEENPHVAGVRAQQATLDAAKMELATLEGLVDVSASAVSDLSTVSELFSPKGMRGEVLDSVTPFLNTRTAQYLGVLSDGSTTAEWRTITENAKGEVREHFHIHVENVHGSDDFDGLSGGEQRKVRIATAMALQDLVASRAERPIKLFIADEADDALDVSGLERLMSVLEEKARAVGTVLVISHNDLADWCSNQITVMKKGGKSHILEM